MLGVQLEPTTLDLEATTPALEDLVNEAVQEVLAVGDVAAELVPNIIGDLDVDRALGQPRLGSAVVRLNLLIAEKITADRSPRDAGTIQGVTVGLAPLESNEDVPSDAVGRIVLNEAEVPNGLSPLRLGADAELLVGVGAEKAVTTRDRLGVVTTIVEPDTLAREANALAASAMTHLVTDRLDDLHPIKEGLDLGLNRAELEPTRSGVLVVLDVLIGQHVGRILLAEDARGVLDLPIAGKVDVGQTDLAGAINNPDIGPTDLGRVRSEEVERHVDWVFGVGNRCSLQVLSL